ncbi:MAG: hypothetical protein M9939_08110 [Mesorhizobium sp.]|nr:hypothetical protein [Mesorhizobium sp.]MCO5161086.1 hypothetical protein [Mesorhizobium sp.]
MTTLPLAIDIADAALRRELCYDPFALDAVADELRIRHPESSATSREIAEALREISCWSGRRRARPAVVA